MKKSQLRMRVKKLPNGIGMQISSEIPSCNLYPGKQRFIVEFLVNRELTSEEIFALLATMEGMTDDIDDLQKEPKIKKEEAKDYKIHNLIFTQDKKQKYVAYRFGFVGEKDTDIGDIDMQLHSALEESIGGSLKLLWCDIFKVRKFPCEKRIKEVIASIPEDKLAAMLERRKKSKKLANG